MTAADRTRKTSLPRFVAHLTQFFARSRRPGHADASSAGGSETSAQIDLGDLAVAQFVHDLRNQLTVIIACSERIFHLVPRSHADQEIAELRHCAERASLLSRELLMAARPRSAARRRVDLNQVVAAAVERLPRFMGDRIRLRVRLSAEPVTVVAEPLELERILLNLALNARDAMAVGGDLTIETEMIVQVPPGGNKDAPPAPCARLTVSDTGCGMTPDVQARMFEPFYTTKEAGTGLGLSSVAFTVRQLQGMVSVESEPGRRTSVTVHLPCPR